MYYNRIKQAFLSIIRPDTTAYPQAITNYKGKDVETVRHSVYGVCSQPPEKSLCLLFQVEGMGGVQYGIFDFAQGRFKNLEPGEVQIGNYLTQASIKFDQEGNVTINVPSGNLNAIVSGNVTAEISGDVTANVAGNLTSDVEGNTTIETNQLSITATNGSFITGDFDVTGDITANNFISDGVNVDFNTHIHTGDSGGNTSAPKSP